MNHAQVVLMVGYIQITIKNCKLAQIYVESDIVKVIINVYNVINHA